MFKKQKKETNFGTYRMRRDLRITQFRQPSMVDSFLCQKHQNAVDGVESVRMTSDIYMLFNAQRLDRMSRDAVLRHFEDMAVKDPSMAALKKRMTDDQLISLVKSRYIQQPSELLAWSHYLNTLADVELQRIVAENEKLAPVHSQPDAPSVAPSPEGK